MRHSINTLIFCLIVILSLNVASASDQIPGAPQKTPILLKGGTVHTVSGSTIEECDVLLIEGKIASVDKSIEPIEGCEVIDCAGKHVYPGLIESLSQLGLVEIDSVRATIDTNESGSINPNVKAGVAVNPDSEAIPVARANGVLLAAVAPGGGLVSGQSSFLMLDGWTWEEMSLKNNLAMHVSWPRFSARFGRGDRSEIVERANKQIDELRQLIHKTRAYAAAKEADSDLPVDRRLESMIPMVNGLQPVVIDADELTQIESAVSFASAENLRAIIYGGYDAPKCAELLKSAGVPIILAGTYRTARNRHDGYDVPYSLPSKLDELGIPFCLSGAGRFGASNVRNLPYHAATAVAYGLDEETALRSITLSVAEILGVSDRVGSIDEGKDATVFVADGDILETPTQLTHALIQGRVVDLSSRHTLLYNKYKTKYDRLKQETR